MNWDNRKEKRTRNEIWDTDTKQHNRKEQIIRPPKENFDPLATRSHSLHLNIFLCESCVFFPCALFFFLLFLSNCCFFSHWSPRTRMRAPSSARMRPHREGHVPWPMDTAANAHAHTQKHTGIGRGFKAKAINKRPSAEERKRRHGEMRRVGVATLARRASQCARGGTEGREKNVNFPTGLCDREKIEIGQSFGQNISEPTRRKDASKITCRFHYFCLLSYEHAQCFFIRSNTNNNMG